MSIATANRLPAKVSLAELANHFNVTKATVSAWSARGEIPEPRKVGKLLFWLRSDLDDLLGPSEPIGQGRQPTVA